MAGKLYITAGEDRCEKETVVLGIMQLLSRRVRRPAFFRPVISNKHEQKDNRDHTINLILSHFGLDMPYDAAYAMTRREAGEMIDEGRHAAMLEIISNKFKYLENHYDFVLCEGTDFTGNNDAFEAALNIDIAGALQIPVAVICDARHRGKEEIISSAQSILDALYKKNIEVAACIVNSASVAAEEETEIRDAIRQYADVPVPPVACLLAEDLYLKMPTVGDVKNWLDAEVLFGEDRLNTLVVDYLVAAMQVGNFLAYLRPGCLVITPGDREDVILACLASRLSAGYPDIAGVVLTGNLKPQRTMRRLVDGWAGSALPIIAVRSDTIGAVQSLGERRGRIEPDNAQKINTAIGFFEAGVDTGELESRVIRPAGAGSVKISPKMFEYDLIRRAASRKMHIVLAEGAEERVLRAVDILARRKAARVTLLGNIEDIKGRMSALGIGPHISVIQPELSPKFEEYAAAYRKMREHEGLDMDQAEDVVSDPAYYGMMMLYKNDAHGVVSGSVNSTARLMRPALEIIKVKDDAAVASSVFFMCFDDRVLVFGDCLINPRPTAVQLAGIAISAARTAGLFGIEPRIAVLSCPAEAPGGRADAGNAAEAVNIVRQKVPELFIEGPLLCDAGAEPTRAGLPGGADGRASVFIFPDTRSCKSVCRFLRDTAGAVAVGPVLQSLNKPVNDLSRDSTVSDIVNIVAVTCIQAQNEFKAGDCDSESNAFI
ncbi:MAG: phosphate acetyltransferase [Desulfovibrio sp.]|jgi:phosphate acetyltransferase|nr:phosphate acetyltransferase [Desulfovibrio sp.]